MDLDFSYQCTDDSGQAILKYFPSANINVSLAFLFTKPVPTLVLLSPQGELFPMSGSHSCYIINLKKKDPNLKIIITKSQQQTFSGWKSKVYCLLSFFKNSLYFPSWDDKALNLLQKLFPTCESLAGRWISETNGHAIVLHARKTGKADERICLPPTFSFIHLITL